MILNASTKYLFLASLVIAVVAVISALGILASVPVPAFWIMTAAYVLLVLSCLMSDL